MITRSEVKYIQSLSDKKFRNESRLFVAEGPKIVGELLQEERVVPVTIYAVEGWKGPVATETKEVSAKELASISFLTTPNQVVGVFRQKSIPSEPNFMGQLSLLLDGIQDPGNMGTIIRIADWFGISWVITTNDSADAYNPKVVQSSMGSIARVNVLQVALTPFLDSYPQIPIYASALNGTPFDEIGKVREGFLAIGNESKGISTTVMDAARIKVTIPRVGQAESLNAAVAAGILLSRLAI